MTEPTVPESTDAMFPLDDVSPDAAVVEDTLVTDVPAPVVPDRADAPVSEITERFLRAILTTVPLERIEELHLFAPLRQGGTETGIAVVAARVIEPPAAAIEVAAVDEVVVAADEASDSPYAIVETVLVLEDDSGSEIAAPTPIVRHTVYTARYRLVLKGSERGKWETDVVDEADAPLVTVETVVRGVQRRAGEETEILRYSDRQIARALRMEWPLPVVDPTA
ncbi:MAG: hypothetical protein IT353_23305 [Gemmatimonadaceae bacterium]|nr:hypothetical protein [Gemmatimonadaceae bacterium]